MKRRTLNRRIAQATGLVGVGILALTGCEGTAEEQQDIQEDGQEGADPDGAEGEHGPEPDEIAEDDDDEEGDDDEEDGLGAGEAPDLAEVEERIWESALEQDSVEIRVTHKEAPEELEEAIGQQPPGDQDDQDQEDQDQETADPDSGAEHAIELIYTGDLAGEGSSASYRLAPLGLEGTFLSFGEELFQDREGFIGDYAWSVPRNLTPRSRRTCTRRWSVGGSTTRRWSPCSTSPPSSTWRRSGVTWTPCSEWRSSPRSAQRASPAPMRVRTSGSTSLRRWS